MQVALLQTPVYTDTAKNLRVAADAVWRAAMRGAQVAVLPEMFCCPNIPASFARYAEPDGGARWQFLRQLSRTSGIFLVAGSMPELFDDAVYSTAYVFTPDGRQLAKHRKVHLDDHAESGGLDLGESAALSPGKGICIFDLPLARCGVAICDDIRFPEYIQHIADAGAEVLFVPASSGRVIPPAHWALLFRARAVDSQMYTIGVSSARCSAAAYQAHGNSIAVSPQGEVLAYMNAEPGMGLVSLDMAAPAAIRAQVPLSAQRAARIVREGR